VPDRKLDKNNEPTDNSDESLLSQVQGTRKDVSASIAKSLGNLKTSLEERTSGSDDFIETRILEARRDLSESKAKIASLARIRELIFGLQDGLISTVVLVSSVYGATSDNGLTIIAGLAGALGGTVSMSAGSFLSSRAEKEVLESQINIELTKFMEDPSKQIDQLVAALTTDGLTEEEAFSITETMAKNEDVLIRTVIEKELGLSLDEVSVPWKDAVVMGISFLLGTAVPILPYLMINGPSVVAISIAATGLGLFAMGVGKSRFTKRNPIMSGIDILSIGILAATAGYFFLGTFHDRILPAIIGG
jgi:predicted membrane protein (TIGR00267 family)|tara:strand:- start:10284 stop:11198 length:915 start_codon:yes stop_codon:yes gene_type:complete